MSKLNSKLTKIDDTPLRVPNRVMSKLNSKPIKIQAIEDINYNPIQQS